MSDNVVIEKTVFDVGGMKFNTRKEADKEVLRRNFLDDFSISKALERPDTYIAMLQNYKAQIAAIDEQAVDVCQPNFKPGECDGWSAQSWSELLGKVDYLVNQDRRISAIKLFRICTGFGLKEAKDWVEARNPIRKEARWGSNQACL